MWLVTPTGTAFSELPFSHIGLPHRVRPWTFAGPALATGPVGVQMCSLLAFRRRPLGPSAASRLEYV
eukprot:6134937-Amphidinium_carterae.1